MLAVNVRHDRDSGGVVQESAAEIVGFKHKMLPASDADIFVAELAKICSNKNGRVKACVHKHKPRKRGRGALAMRAGYRDRRIALREAAEHRGVGERPHF